MKQDRTRGSLLFILTGILTMFCLNPAMAAGKMLGNNYVIDLRAGEAVFDSSETSTAVDNTFRAMDNNGVIGHEDAWNGEFFDLDQDGTKDLAYKTFGTDSVGTEWFSLSVQKECKIHGSVTLVVNNETREALDEDGYEYYEKLTFLFPEVLPVSIAGVSVIGIANKEYTGKPITQNVTVKLSDLVLREGIHYTVSYQDNTAPGTATVLINGKGTCTGTVTKTFQITKAAAKEAETEAAQKAATVKKAQTIVKGKVYTVSGLKYKVTSPGKKGKGTVTLIGTTQKKSKLQTLNIPAAVKINGVTLKVTAVGNNAFQKYTKLRTVTIGKNVRTIGKNAFFKCSALKTIVIKTTKLTAKTVGANAFKGTYKKAKVKVPKAKLKSYAALLKKRGIGKSAKFTR